MPLPHCYITIRSRLRQSFAIRGQPSWAAEAEASGLSFQGFPTDVVRLDWRRRLDYSTLRSGKPTSVGLGAGGFPDKGRARTRTTRRRSNINANTTTLAQVTATRLRPKTKLKPQRVKSSDIKPWKRNCRWGIYDEQKDRLYIQLFSYLSLILWPVASSFTLECCRGSEWYI